MQALRRLRFLWRQPSYRSKAGLVLSAQLREDSGLHEEISDSDREYQEFSENCLKIDRACNCYIVQPYIKWGPQKLRDITPSEQMDEAKALISTLPSWTVEDVLTVPLESFDKKTLFKSGSLDKLKQLVRGNSNINAVFINLGTVKKVQVVNLEKELGVPILDRYKIVMQIFKIHATSKHAKLQVALAELYYLQRIAFSELNVAKQDRENIKLMFQNQEQKLKTAIKDLRTHRSILRVKRHKSGYPVIAVVGYTNSGKTSLIKALTGEDQLKPKDQLFATLDVTVHAGLLPSSLEVLYVDTVGFISDIPTNLIECFIATLEDAVLADVILHVEDIASPCFEFKRKHVLATLQNLGTKADYNDVMNKIISVGNKCDLVGRDQDFGILKVSAKTDVGLDRLRLMLESSVMAATDRRHIKIRIPTGGDEIRWLYKNSTVIAEIPDEKNSQFMLADVVITHVKLQQFKHYYSK